MSPPAEAGDLQAVADLLARWNYAALSLATFLMLFIAPWVDSRTDKAGRGPALRHTAWLAFAGLSLWWLQYTVALQTGELPPPWRDVATGLVHFGDLPVGLLFGGAALSLGSLSRRRVWLPALGGVLCSVVLGLVARLLVSWMVPDVLPPTAWFGFATVLVPTLGITALGLALRHAGTESRFPIHQGEAGLIFIAYALVQPPVALLAPTVIGDGAALSVAIAGAMFTAKLGVVGAAMWMGWSTVVLQQRRERLADLRLRLEPRLAGAKHWSALTTTLLEAVHQITGPQVRATLWVPEQRAGRPGWYRTAQIDRGHMEMLTAPETAEPGLVDEPWRVEVPGLGAIGATAWLDLLGGASLDQAATIRALVGAVSGRCAELRRQRVNAFFQVIAGLTQTPDGEGGPAGAALQALVDHLPCSASALLIGRTSWKPAAGRGTALEGVSTWLDAELPCPSTEERTDPRMVPAAPAERQSTLTSPTGALAIVVRSGSVRWAVVVAGRSPSAGPVAGAWSDDDVRLVEGLAVALGAALRHRLAETWLDSERKKTLAERAVAEQARIESQAQAARARTAEAAAEQARRTAEAAEHRAQIQSERAKHAEAEAEAAALRAEESYRRALEEARRAVEQGERAQRAEAEAQAAALRAEGSHRLALEEARRAVEQGERAQRAEVEAQAAVATADEAKRQALDEAQRAREAEAARQKFFGTLQHELRSPVSNIGLAADVILARLASAPRARTLLKDQVETILIEQTRFEALFRDWAHVASVLHARGRPRLEVLDLSELVAEVLDGELAGSLQGHALRRSLGRGLRVHGDRTVLQRVVVNLVGNALKHGVKRPGDPIVVETGRGERDRVRLVVRDAGPGVALADRGRIFNAFARGGDPDEASSGAGLGLHIVALAVEAHNGEVMVQNNSDLPQPVHNGRGASFFVYLPGIP